MVPLQKEELRDRCRGMELEGDLAENILLCWNLTMFLDWTDRGQ